MKVSAGNARAFTQARALRQLHHFASFPTLSFSFPFSSDSQDCEHNRYNGVQNMNIYKCRNNKHRGMNVDRNFTCLVRNRVIVLRA